MHEELGVSLVDDAPENSKLHFLRIGEVVVGKREIAVRLGAVQSLDSVPRWSIMFSWVMACTSVGFL